MSVNVNNLEELVEPILNPGQKIVSYQCENLLPPGENYGSVMVKVQFKILNENGEEDTLDCVAKTVPPSEFLWKVFNTKVTFKKEIGVYTTVVPELNGFGREQGIDCLMNFFAKSLGARISLDPKSDIVDKDAVLILENLKVQGYDIGDRFMGFDEETTKYLLRDLATLHAAPIAYSSAKPEEFQEKILPFLRRSFDFHFEEDVVANLIVNMQNAVGRNPKCVPHLYKIEDAMRKMKYNMENPPMGNKIFNTFVHHDFWVNNTMLKYENGKPIGNKIVDFQGIEHSSLAHDVIFFLYSSVSLPVLKKKVDEFIRFYYECFVETLVKLRHDVSEYSFELMLEEFALMARDAQFTHILFMLTPIMTMKGKAVELSELKPDNMLDQDVLHENYYDKIQFFFLDFIRRGWI